MATRFAAGLSVSLAVSFYIGTAAAASADGSTHHCVEEESWDVGMSMCMPTPSAAGSRLILSGQFNAYGVFSAQQGSRGVNQFAAPNMFMVDAGHSIGTLQFMNLDIMGTTELWSYPQHGYAELLQVGEEHSDGAPFIDAQHPHSSPIMGLTFSDTVSFNQAQTLKLFFAPRGESTDGPVAFMHRDSARDNPDAPLGHHVGQDVGHISSTVLGAQLDLGTWAIDASVFNGTEPEPAHVDLPMGSLNSTALRVTYLLGPTQRVMASIAHVDQLDPAYPGTTSATRISASIYNHLTMGNSGTLDHTFIVGSITRRPNPLTLTSFLDEATLTRETFDLWERIEVLQRLSSELEIPIAASDVNAEKRWVSALTFGVTHWLTSDSRLQVGIGSSLTMDVIPSDWVSAYGHRTPLTARLILQVRGSGRWKY